MRILCLSLLTLLAIGACVEDPNADVGVAASELSEVSATTAPVTRSTDWSQTMSANDLWPRQGVSDVRVMLRRGETSTSTVTAAVQINYLAFVVWNGNTIGRIYRVRLGADADDFMRKLNVVAEARTSLNSSWTWGMQGSLKLGGRPPVPPYPGGNISFSTSFLRTTIEMANLSKLASDRFLAASY